MTVCPAVMDMKDLIVNRIVQQTPGGGFLRRRGLFIRINAKHKIEYHLFSKPHYVGLSSSNSFVFVVEACQQS